MRKPILVTGSHRSGTTWVGRMLSLSEEVGYIHEPFNIGVKPGVTGLELENWFTYITGENPELRRTLSNTLEFHYHFKKALRSATTLKDFLRIVRDVPVTWMKKIKNCRPLMKDPIAIMSVEWLYRNFGMDVIIMVRHPASFVSSLKKYEWSHPFQHFLDQKDLMEEKLSPFRKEIEEYSVKEKDIVDQGILLWKIIYHVVKDYIDNFPKLQLVKYEDLAKNPVNQFKKIYGFLGLEFTDDIEAEVLQHSRSSNPKEVSGNEPMKTRRNSAEQVEIFKERLEESVIAKIKRETRDVWEFYYSEADW